MNAQHPTSTAERPTAAEDTLNCPGYVRLIAAVEHDEKQDSRHWHDYRGKLAWIVARAKHYAEKTGLTAEAILDAWEGQRDYWYMNYYQDANQPLIKDGKARVFETLADLQASIGTSGFRCPACAGVSRSPYECTSGKVTHGKTCDWKVYGLLGHLGKGVSVYVKEKLQGESIFMPVAWEKASFWALVWVWWPGRATGRTPRRSRS